VVFTLLLHRALRHRKLHPATTGKCLPETLINELRDRKEHTAQTGHEAGATPPLGRTARSGVVGSLPPRIAGLRDEFCAACNDEF
jgi:hypothetical protein